MDKTKQQLINRGNNLVSTVIIVLSGLAFLPETFIEVEKVYKVDDGLLFILGGIALWWYRRANNRFSRSIVPTIIIMLALATKIMAIIIEHKDSADVGDDFGALILFLSATVFSIWLYKRSTVAVKN